MALDGEVIAMPFRYMSNVPPIGYMYNYMHLYLIHSLTS